MNKLGEKGLYSKATMKKFRDDAKHRTYEMAELTTKVAALEAEKDVLRRGGTVRSGLSPQIEALKEEIEGLADTKAKKSVKHVIPEDDDKEEDEPVQKKRATKAKVKKAEVKTDEAEAPAEKLAQKPRRKKAVKRKENVAEEVRVVSRNV
jgi:hypothetical protein